MKIIPAIDIIGGKCVRLTQGNYGQCKIYSANPLEMARLFEEAGLDRLHFFKQKTAYELCGRDWSSDVCSSDLDC